MQQLLLPSCISVHFRINKDMRGPNIIQFEMATARAWHRDFHSMHTLCSVSFQIWHSAVGQLYVLPEHCTDCS